MPPPAAYVVVRGLPFVPRQQPWGPSLLAVGYLWEKRRCKECRGVRYIYRYPCSIFVFKVPGGWAWRSRRLRAAELKGHVRTYNKKPSVTCTCMGKRSPGPGFRSRGGAAKTIYREAS